MQPFVLFRHAFIVLRNFILISGTAGFLATAALAQDSSDPNRTIYDTAYFSAFSVFTAEDMLNRVPGVQDLLTEAKAAVTAQTAATPTIRRGFGTGGDQILINGRRLSGKANNIFTALQRIQANQVLRIEVIRGTVPDLDVRSDGLLVNIVLREALMAGSGSWEGTMSRYTGNTYRPGGKLSYSADIGALTYIVGVTAIPRYDLRTRVDPLKTPAGVLFQRQVESQRIDATDITATGGLTYAFSNGDRANLNGRFADQGQDEVEYSDRTNIAGASEAYFGTFLQLRNLKYTSWEVGGDYEHAFANDDVLKTLFVVNSSSQNDHREFDVQLASLPNRLDRFQIQAPDRGERILRGTYRTHLTPEHTVELGAEAAINSLKQTIQLQSNATGSLVNIPLFNSQAKIDERRFETNASDTWQPRPDLQVEGAFDTEYSRLRQRGTSVNQSRTFFFVKPRVDIRYDATSQIQVRGRVQRTVSQLDFAGFILGFLNDDSANDVIRSGNPNLVPEKAWEFSIAGEKRLGADQGLVSVEPFYNMISDRIEKLAVPGTVTGAIGNIGRANDYGVRLNAGLRLGWLSLPHGQFDLNATFRKTRVHDGFTFLPRTMQNTPGRMLVASFRNDIEWRSLAYGLTVTDRSNTTSFDYDFLQIVHLNTQFDSFVEAQVVKGVTLRFDARRFMGTGATRLRLNYVGNRLFDRLLTSEFRTGDFGREYKLSLRGRF